MTMNPEELKQNFEEQLATTEKQIAELEGNLAKAREYKTKLQGGLETLQLLNGDQAEPEAAEAPTEVVE